MELFSLKPYIKKQILLEDEKEEAQKEELFRNMTALVWDAFSDKSFAGKLSKWVNMPQEKFNRYNNIPKSKHLSSVQIKKMIQAGPNAGPHTAWMGWKAGTNPPTPDSVSIDKGWFGDRTKYEWSKAPSEKITDRDGFMDRFKIHTGGDRDVRNDMMKTFHTQRKDKREKAKQQEIKDTKPLEKMPVQDVQKYEWENYGKLVVAQQMSGLANSKNDKDGVKDKIRELIGLFGGKEYITGKEASAIYRGDAKVFDGSPESAFYKVFMSMGVNPDKSIISNDQRAFKLIKPEILKGFLKGDGLYFTKDGDTFSWTNDIKKASSADKTVGKEGGLFSDDVDPMKYVPGLLAFASTRDGAVKLQKFLMDLMAMPVGIETHKKQRHAKIKVGDDKHGYIDVPAKIFIDGGTTYVNQQWQNWAEKEGTDKTMPLWDDGEWKFNDTGKSPATTSWGDLESLEGDDDEMAMKSADFYHKITLNVRQHQSKIADEFIAELDKLKEWGTVNFFKELLSNNPDLSVDMLNDFRHVLGTKGTLKRKEQEGAASSIEPSNSQFSGVELGPSGAIVRSSANLNLRNLIDLTTTLFEAEDDEPKVTAQQLANANEVLKAIGMSGWHFSMAKPTPIEPPEDQDKEEWIDTDKDDEFVDPDIKDDEEEVIVEPKPKPEWTDAHLKAIMVRLSKNGHKSGPRDPGGIWSKKLQAVLKIGATGSTADFKKRWNDVAKVVKNSTIGKFKKVPPPIPTIPWGGKVISKGTPIKMYDPELANPDAVEIINAVKKKYPNFAKVWEARKNKPFKLTGDAVVFYYFGIAIQVAATPDQYRAMVGKKKPAPKPELGPTIAQAPGLGKGEQRKELEKEQKKIRMLADLQKIEDEKNRRYAEELLGKK